MSRLKAAKVAAESELEQEKQLTEQRTRVLELYYSDSLISLRDYYDTRKTIADSALSTELKAIQAKASGMHGAIACTSFRKRPRAVLACACESR